MYRYRHLYPDKSALVNIRPSFSNFKFRVLYILYYVLHIKEKRQFLQIFYLHKPVFQQIFKGEFNLKKTGGFFQKCFFYRVAEALLSVTLNIILSLIFPEIFYWNSLSRSEDMKNFFINFNYFR